MELLFEYKQTKKNNRTNVLTKCAISISSDDKILHMGNKFIFDQALLPKGLHGKKGEMVIEHVLSLNYLTGNFTTYYDVTFLNEENYITKKDKIKTLKNNFKSLFDLTESGYYFGEKPIYPGWGIKYKTQMVNGFNIMKKHLQTKMNSKFLKEKDYQNPSVNSFFDLVVDYHIDIKGIKGHNNIYQDIIHNYPTLKYLKLNDMKFIPAILDQHNIKTSHYISELNNNIERDGFHVKTLKYLCNLFGDEHVNYLNKCEWVIFCTYKITSNKQHTLKNDNERKSLLEVLIEINEHDIHNALNIIQSTFNMMTFREFIEKKGFQVKFNSKSIGEFKSLSQEWKMLQKQFRRGYRVSYVFPYQFIDSVEKDIEVDGNSFTVKLLKSEEDFIFEGEVMKNCIGKQFTHGSAFIYLSLLMGGKRVNLQYGNGKLTMSFGKANSDVPEEFKGAIDLLNIKMKKYADMKWNKQKIILH